MALPHTDGRCSPTALTQSGRVLIEAMRHARCGAAATLACFDGLACETRSRACFVVFLQIVHSLALHGRRRMRVGTVGLPLLTPDEVALLRCVEAAACEDRAALAAHVEWVVRRRGADEFTGYLTALASLLPEDVFRRSPGPALTLVGGGGAERPMHAAPAPAYPIAVT